MNWTFYILFLDSQEELDEIEALLEREQELLGQQDHSHHTSVNLLHSPGTCVAVISWFIKKHLRLTYM